MSVISYGVQLNHLSRCLDPTIRVYRDAVRYLVDIVLLHYDDIKDLLQLSAQQHIERLVHSTGDNKAVYPEFDRRFYKFPSYLRRDAINNAIGKVSGYKAQLLLWESEGCKGRRPRMNFNQDTMPCFYKGNMFRDRNGHGFQIKVYRDHDWVWQDIELNRSDLRYIHDRCAGLKESAPVLCKAYGKYILRFAYKADFSDQSKFVKDVDVQKAIGADLGLNTDAVCTGMLRDGTVTGCKFIDSPVEKDRLYTLLNVIRGAQQHGSRHMHRLWRYADHYNREIAVKTASAIVNYAVEQKAEVIVFENLSDLKGRVNGSKKQRIGIWRKRDIQVRTSEMAARFGIRTAYVCAWNTSRLAFDGSGAVVRDDSNHALCTFATGKHYNCDLSASKNITARYFIRAIKKSIPETEWLYASAKVPELCTRTQCTLSTLISLSAVTEPSAA